MLKARYGIDAPGLVKVFLIVGLVSGLAGTALRLRANDRLFMIILSLLSFIIMTYSLGMFTYMLWSSLVGKVGGREAVLDLVKWSGNEQVLDVGCGRGLFLVGAAHRLTTGHATGIDLWVAKDQSDNHRDAPFENARREGVSDRVSVQTGDMRHLPFADARFDVVMSGWVVHNLDAANDRALALSEMVRVLRPGGTLLLNDIENRDEYKAEFMRLGLLGIKLVTPSPWLDRLNGLISFGSFRPATLVGQVASRGALRA